MDKLPIDIIKLIKYYVLESPFKTQLKQINNKYYFNIIYE